MGKSVIVEKAKKISEEQIQKVLFVGLALFVLLFPLIQYIWPNHIIGNQLQSVFLIVLSLFFACVFGVEYINGRMKMKNIPTFTVFGMILFGLISCIYNGKLNTTIYGDELQGHGFLVIVTYYVVFLAASQLKEKTYRRWLMRFLCLALGFIALYGVLQFFHVPFMVHKSVRAAVYPTDNQNFYGAFPVLYVGIIYARLLYKENVTEKKSRETMMLHIMVMLGFAACISADSLLVYMGIIMQFLLIIFLEIITRRHRYGKIGILMFEFVIVFLIFDVVSGGEVIKEFLSLFLQIKQEGTVFGDSVGTGRMRIWKETLSAIPKNWAFGCGIGCSYQNHGISDAHNEYLQIWAEQGSFAVISYLVFLFSLFIPGILQFIKKDFYDSDFVSKAAMFAFFGYIAQAFANIRVLQVAPYFWLCSGLLYVRKHKNGGNLTHETEKHTS